MLIVIVQIEIKSGNSTSLYISTSSFLLYISIVVQCTDINIFRYLILINIIFILMITWNYFIFDIFKYLFSYIRFLNFSPCLLLLIIYIIHYIFLYNIPTYVIYLHPTIYKLVESMIMHTTCTFKSNKNNVQKD